LLSAPDAGIYAGAGWFKAVIDTACAASPAADFSAVLDCGDDAGAAQAALRAGIGAIVFTGRTDVAERLAGIASATGARVLTARPAADLDLLAEFFSDAATLRRRCKAVFDVRT
jgi:acyl-CoA reductase-like NAD-dependent aldehyde dehydrogenase